VYSVTNIQCQATGQGYVYKEYKQYARPDADILVSFSDFYYSLSTNDKYYLNSICCWPHELVEDKGSTSGFLMIRIPEKFFRPINFSGGPKVVEAKFEHLLLPERLLKRRQLPLTDKARYKLLLSVVRGLNFFHQRGACIGDFSHSNILFSLCDCSVFFLDCDSFRLSGDTVFTQTETGNWGVRERYPEEELATPESDIYKLGLLALRLLMKSGNSAHYQASANTDRLPVHIEAGVKAIIEDSLKDASNRPALAAWSSVLHTAIVSCISEPAAQRAAVASSVKSASASEVFNVFPTSVASRSAAVAPLPSQASQAQPSKREQQRYKPITLPPVQEQYSYPPVQEHSTPQPSAQKKQGGKLGLTSFVLGIAGSACALIGFFLHYSNPLFYFLAIISAFSLPLAFIFGWIGLRGSKRGFSMTGLVLGAVYTVVVLWQVIVRALWSLMN
jgi:serine/threonine protein kinase